jgi:hypothetical protein
MLEKGPEDGARAKGIDDFLRPTHLISDETRIVVGGPVLRLVELSRYYFGTETI